MALRELAGEIHRQDTVANRGNRRWISQNPALQQDLSHEPAPLPRAPRLPPRRPPPPPRPSSRCVAACHTIPRSPASGATTG
eukprot:scaffold26268_cov59-Phaeocystis_antarctica.AAC.3